MISFPTKRNRPDRFSNKNCCHSDEEMSTILDRSDEELGWSEFRSIFEVAGCSAAPTEQEYFLPLALKYLRAHPREGDEFLSHIVYFLSTQSEFLAPEGVLSYALDGLRACFSTWTQSFVIRHYDTAACQAKRWRRDHDDIVENSQFVSDLISELLHYKTHDALAREFVGTWVAGSRSDTQAAWLIEYAREQRDAYTYYQQNPGPVDMIPSRSDEFIHGVIMDQALLGRCAEQIRDRIIALEPSPTYWLDTLRVLGLASP